jgi:hypothetical protein
MNVQKRHIYGIIGHQIPEGDGAPDGIEMYTEELVKIQLEIQELEKDVSELSVGRFGQVNPSGDESLLAQIRSAVDEPQEIIELEERYLKILERIAGSREALVSGHISEAGIDPDDYSDHTRQNLHKWVDDGTFPDYIRELERGADRLGHRLAAKRETVNTRNNLLISITTLAVSCLIVVFGALSVVAALI